MNRNTWVIAAALLLAACGQSGTAPPAPPLETETTAPVESTAPVAFREVDAALLAAPSSGFTAVEPSELGVTGGADIRDALGDLIATGVHEDGEPLHFTVRETGDIATADLVRSGIADESVSGGHVRVEFHREPEGWFPTNAYRRWMCARGPEANQWTTTPCP